ncbi:hypothetical protein TVAG_432220 [Trichomonas vaginalis G3]|uniref:Uncharacterized protein n=1 Tax=Trichomonas vaginalis (strain ATCC PRA-98 / G3) TaxID=412133 RepID=A2F8T6_TRIV3|nr:hypothetical protein TVAGG3_0126600 [Trichomonas vaginalis G3]EAX98672.1 hypothetical protein TVAG_432220 [Trichomonas vaginalis G3]KAI5545803.1 hypothetical protein TVAGG3_0126600 [Trichomonas vaginalis G3]|eukprot:XP_001311602.1 hypothetical protein [Trichomonas vaginalis G3]
MINNRTPPDSVTLCFEKSKWSSRMTKELWRRRWNGTPQPAKKIFNQIMKYNLVWRDDYHIDRYSRIDKVTETEKQYLKEVYGEEELQKILE